MNKDEKIKWISENYSWFICFDVCQKLKIPFENVDYKTALNNLSEHQINQLHQYLKEVQSKYFQKCLKCGRSITEIDSIKTGLGSTCRSKHFFGKNQLNIEF